MEDLKELIEFYEMYLVCNPDTGKFIWKPRDKRLFKTKAAYTKWNNKYAHNDAITSLNKGYLRSQIEDKHHYGHRIMWITQKGEIPIFVDHENGITTDNKLSNLQNVTPKINGMNKKIPINNSSGLIGVKKLKSGKWKSRIKIDGKDINLGVYDDIEQAIQIRKEAEEQYGFHRNHGMR